MNKIDIYVAYMDGLRSRVIEERVLSNYPILCFNCIWIARDISPYDACKYDICNLATNILSSIQEVRALRFWTSSLISLLF